MACSRGEEEQAMPITGQFLSGDVYCRITDLQFLPVQKMNEEILMGYIFFMLVVCSIDWLVSWLVGRHARG